MSPKSDPSTEDSDYEDTRRRSSRKRRKIAFEQPPISNADEDAFPSLLETLSEEIVATPDGGYEEFMNDTLPEYLQARLHLQEGSYEPDESGKRLRPPTRAEISNIANLDIGHARQNINAKIVLRKTKLARERRRAGVAIVEPQVHGEVVVPLPLVPPSIPPNSVVLDTLEAIQTTPFEHSFLSRLWGARGYCTPGLIAVDWETQTPWMKLMIDLRAHYRLAHPQREYVAAPSAPIVYTSLRPDHLVQVHDLLERVFWAGIDVSDALEHAPESCTVVAAYRRLVVGVAILSSPQEAYITYLAVKAGWDNAQIARTMLFHLIGLNPHRDITLHVSANNSAMLLYNKFGFKAEEFIVGFYEDYLDPQSRASKNGFRLRSGSSRWFKYFQPSNGGNPLYKATAKKEKINNIPPDSNYTSR
ncbi:hypothetical protein BD779DRAFT_1101417 [Infundibulicybe gibba]|nr:hypothetical protein BD779DRAFT_1101417 [Infundibulicybe gibba]